MKVGKIGLVVGVEMDQSRNDSKLLLHCIDLSSIKLSTTPKSSSLPKVVLSKHVAQHSKYQGVSHNSTGSVLTIK